MALILLIDKIVSAIVKDDLVLEFFLDLSKAFDTAHHIVYRPACQKGLKKLDSFHPPYTKGLKVSYERVRPQESKNGGCVDGRHQRCHGNDG